ncbi:Endonuclease/exonuclease/phosphatase [Amanita muscaria]
MQAISPVIPNLLLKSKGYRYRAQKNGWKHIHLNKPDDRKCPTQIRIITWNISFDMPGRVERLERALRHLQIDVLRCQEGGVPEPCCILLQELNVEAFPYLLKDQWVREYFVLTPISPEKWPANAIYGNVTLISRSVPIVDCSIVHFGSSAQQRTGVVVDVRLRYPSRDEDSTSVLRIINTHLESLPSGFHARRMQLQLLAKMLSAELKEWRGGIIAGDMNAIGPNEHEYPEEVGLDDAWKGSEDCEEGHTWGYQTASQYPAARLDKILYLPRRDYKLSEPKRVGVAVSVKDPTSGNDLPLFVSDHYGLDTVLRMSC